VSVRILGEDVGVGVGVGVVECELIAAQISELVG